MNSKASKIILLDEEKELLKAKLECDIRSSEKFIKENIIVNDNNIIYKNEADVAMMLSFGITADKVIKRTNMLKRIVAKLG